MLISGKTGFDTAIGFVAYPATQAELHSLMLGMVAKTNPLYAAMNAGQKGAGRYRAFGHRMVSLAMALASA